MIKEELHILHNKTSPKDLRKFAFTIGAVLFIFSVFLWYKSSDFYVYPVIAGLMLVMAGFIKPQGLKYIYLGWMSIALVLGFFVTRIILTVIFFIVFTPVGLILRLLGKDLLNQKLWPVRNSYWIQKSNDLSPQHRAEKQF